MSDFTGLAETEAKRRLDRDGPNAVADPTPTWANRLARRFWGPIPWLLQAAIILQIVLGERLEAALIAVLMVFNALLGVVQERRADRALRALRSKLIPDAYAMRDGRWSLISSAGLVVGDVVKVSLGAIVPADCRVLDGAAALDQSSLTGESVFVERTRGDLAYAGAFVRRGQLVAEVVATGARTYFGRAAQLVSGAHVESSEEAAILSAVRGLATANGAVVIALVTYAHLHGWTLAMTIPLVLSALLATVPVALPATFTLAGSLAARALAARGVLLTRLSEVHEAASIDLLCVDKTGTLTENTLRIETVVPFDGATRESVLAFAAAASVEGSGDPVDSAIRSVGDASGMRVETLRPFDPTTKISEAEVLDPRDNVVRTVVKGAPDRVALRARPAPGFDDAARDLAQQGCRVIAVACGRDERLALIGLIGFSDPPRSEASSIVERLRTLGVQMRILTGDGAETALHVAAAVGIRGAVCPPDVINDAHGEPCGVHAGVLPEDKFHLVRSLQDAGFHVGMCGDGTNDAPALRQAHLGVAVAGATDVAKGAAGMVLLTPGLTGLVSAIEQGRSTFQVVLAYSLASLARKIQLVLFLALGVVMFDRAPLTPLLMVLILIANDFFSMALVAERGQPAARPCRWRVRRWVMVGAALGMAELLVATGTLFVMSRVWLFAPGQLATAAFVVQVLAAQALIFVVREPRRFWQSRPTRWLWLAMAVNSLLVVFVGRSAVLSTAISWPMFGVAAAAAIALLFVTDQLKLWLRPWLVG